MMARYLSHTRIEGPAELEPCDISFLRVRIFDAETQIESIEAQISELMSQKHAKLVEIALLKNILSPVRRVPLESAMAT